MIFDLIAKKLISYTKSSENLGVAEPLFRATHYYDMVFFFFQHLVFIYLFIFSLSFLFLIFKRTKKTLRLFLSFLGLRSSGGH